LLINQNAKAKYHARIGIDAEEYYKIKGVDGGMDDTDA
jgi:hypothetical protein